MPARRKPPPLPANANNPGPVKYNFVFNTVKLRATPKFKVSPVNHNSHNSSIWMHNEAALLEQFRKKWNALSNANKDKLKAEQRNEAQLRQLAKNTKNNPAKRTKINPARLKYLLNKAKSYRTSSGVTAQNLNNLDLRVNVEPYGARVDVFYKGEWIGNIGNGRTNLYTPLYLYKA